MGDVTVRHEIDSRRFEAVVDGHACVLEYEWAGERMAILHTGVPAAVGGRGIAARLTRAALDWAREQEVQVVAQCAYVAGYVLRHPEYRDIVDPA